MSKSAASSETRNHKAPASSETNRESNGAGASELDDPERTMSRVAKFIEQLHGTNSSPHEKELVTAHLLGICKSRKEARLLIGSHSQAMPLFISILRNGTNLAKVNVAATLSVMSREEELRVRVLLGGCIPPLLSLLKSESIEARKAAAEAIFAVSSGCLLHDHVGMKIFVTEGVVPRLWEQLDPKRKQDKVVEGYVTGALRNLCGEKDGYWTATLEAGGVDIIVTLLSSDNSVAQSNAASLLARVILAFSVCIPKLIASGAISALLSLLGQKNDVSVRANAADALEALTSRSTEAKKYIVDGQGISILIGAIVAPSKEAMKGGGQNLQQHATKTLANICGGMSAFILYLAELAQSPRLSAPVADIIGALAYSLMIFEQSSEEKSLDATEIENILIMLLKPRDNKLVQERLLEAMACLYSNAHLSETVTHPEAKKVLTGLITMASGDAQESLILSLIHLCCENVGIWEAIGRREGIQLLISFLGLSSEQHQEYAVVLLKILTDQFDDSKWAVTAAGGIPPLVQLLEMGSQKAREDAANVLYNLCTHSEDIRNCVESTQAVPAFLWLLKNGGSKGQETAAKVLMMLIRAADSMVINQLMILLLGDSPNSKEYITKVLGHVLGVASYSDLVQNGAAANKGLRSLIQVLSSSNERNQEYAASVLADLFSSRHDICNSLATDEAVARCKKLLASNTQGIATQSARALGALSCHTKTKSSTKKSYIDEGDIKPLIKMAKTSSIDSAKTAVATLANLLSDPQVAAEALSEDVVSALTRGLGEGLLEGKKSATRALHQLLRHFPVGDVLSNSAQHRFTVLSILDAIDEMDTDWKDVLEALDVVAQLARTKQRVSFDYQLWSALTDAPSGIEVLVKCLSEGPPEVQNKVVEILSRLCGDPPAVLSNSLIERSRSISALANRIMNSSSLEVRVGGVALLICVAKEHRVQSMDVLDASGYLKPLIYALVDMMKEQSCCSMIDVRTPRDFSERNIFQEGDDFGIPNPATVLGGTVALWLLSIMSSYDVKNKLVLIEAGGLEALYDKLASFSCNWQADFQDAEGIWLTALLVAILFQDEGIVYSPGASKFIPSLDLLLKSREVIDRYFAAQAIASVVSHGSRDINLVVTNSGVVAGLIGLLGHIEMKMPNLISLSEDFSLVRNPDQAVLELLFEMDDVGYIAHKNIPLLVDLLRPMPDRPGAPPFVVRLLTKIADGNDANKLVMAEAGALDALSRYMSLSPQGLNEAAISELLEILFSNPDLLHYEATISCTSQLIAVLHLGSKSARYSSAKALDELFDSEEVRNCEASAQAIQPLLDMLGSTSVREQAAALAALIKLTSHNSSRAALVANAEGNPLGNLLKIISSHSSFELKSNAAELCAVLFCNAKVREMPLAADFIEPLMSLIQSGSDKAVESGICAMEKMLDDEQLVELASAYDIVGLLVHLVIGSSYRLTNANICALIKLGKDRTPRKLDMVNAGIIDNCLQILHAAPSSLCSTIAELFRILTNSSAISKSPVAEKMVEPLFTMLLRSDFNLWGQHSALQALVNILEKPQSLATLKLTPGEIVEQLTTYVESPSQAIQLLGTDLLSHLLDQEHFKQDIGTQNAVEPLVHLAGVGILSLQLASIKALKHLSLSCPKTVADAGGIFELSKVIIQDEPEPPDTLLELAALVLSNILRSNVDYCFKVPLVVLVKMLHSSRESTLTTALSALAVQERNDAVVAELMVEAGVVDALLDLLRSHHCEEASAKLLESLFNNARIREMKVSRYAIAPLAQYLLDPQTRSQSGKLLAALALGDLSQHEGLARASNSVSACRALINLLEDQPTEEMKVVAVCALQNFVMRSQTNRRAIAEAGGILVIQELLLSANADIAAQAALLVKFLFSNHTLQEYVSNELIRSLTGAFEKELWSTATINEEVLRTIHVIFLNFPKLHISEAATLCIPHLVAALKSDNEAAQDSALNTLCLLKQSWSSMSIDVSKSQAMVATEAIPVLQRLMDICPPSFHDRADTLLQSLPGCLTVTIKRANNLRHLMGGTNAFCRLTIGNGPARQTKVVSHSVSPEWEESFSWAFDVPPKGQKLHLVCKSRSTFGKTSLGRVTIQIDKVVSEGAYSGEFSLRHQARNKDSSSRSRTIEIDITWSNRLSDKSVKDGLSDRSE